MKPSVLFAIVFSSIIFLTNYVPLSLLVFFFMCCAILAIWFYKSKSSKLYITITVASILAFIVVVINPARIADGLYDQSLAVSARVDAVNEQSVDIKILTINDLRVGPGYRVRLFEPDQDIRVGEIVIGKIVLRKPQKASNLGQFDFERYLRQQGIVAVAYDMQVYSAGEPVWKSALMAGISTHVLKRANRISELEKGVLLAMVAGDKTSLSSDVKQTFQGAGLSHLLVVSGLHVAVIAAIVLWIAIRVLKFSYKSAAWITIMIIVCYAAFVGYTVSVTRSVLMLILLLLARAYYSNRDSLTTVSVAVVVVLAINPFALYSPAFLLSFAATAGILWLVPAIEHAYPHKVVSYIKVPLAAQLATLPIIILFFNYIPIYGIVANLLLVPVGMVTLVLGLLYLLPGGAILLSFPLKISLAILYNGAEFFARLPLGQYAVKPWPLGLVLVYYLCLLGIVSLRGRKIKATLLASIGAFIVIIVFLTGAINGQLFTISFLDVGQGDSLVMQWPNGFTCLVDAGFRGDELDKGASVVLPYLRYKGLNTLGAAIVSHGHDDHLGGLTSILENVRVQQVYTNGSLVEEDVPQLLIKHLQGNTKVLQEGDIIHISPGSYISVLSPPRERKLSFLTENDSSLVLKVVYGGISILLTGDIEAETEQYLVEKYAYTLKSDILKVPHHGSLTSSITPFVNAVEPQFAVVSVGNNYYGHPSAAVLQRYKNNGCEVFRTDKHGAVTFTTDGTRISVDVFNGKR